MQTPADRESDGRSRQWTDIVDLVLTFDGQCQLGLAPVIFRSTMSFSGLMTQLGHGGFNPAF